MGIDPLGLYSWSDYGSVHNTYGEEEAAELLRQTNKYGKGGTKALANGKYRFYDKLKLADKPGEMMGMRRVREWDPATGTKRTWMETLDREGKVRQVRPQTSDGLKVHYMFDADGNFIGKW